jgi:hypothetical protein
MTTTILNATIQGGTQNNGDGVTHVITGNPNVDARIAAAQARAAAAAAKAQGTAVTAPTPPTPPAEPGTFVFRGPDGSQTITIPPISFGRENVIPQQAVDITIAFFLTMAAIIIGLPLARAFARRMDRRGGATQLPTEIGSQLTQLNQAVDAIALEVERISEGQRYTTRLLAEQHGTKLPTGTER